MMSAECGLGSSGLEQKIRSFWGLQPPRVRLTPNDSLAGTPPAESVHGETVRFLSSISCRGTLPNEHLREGRKITADPLFFYGMAQTGGWQEVYYTLVNLNPCITACFRVVSNQLKLTEKM